MAQVSARFGVNLTVIVTEGRDYVTLHKGAWSDQMPAHEVAGALRAAVKEGTRPDLIEGLRWAKAVIDDE